MPVAVLSAPGGGLRWYSRARFGGRLFIAFCLGASAGGLSGYSCAWIGGCLLPLDFQRGPGGGWNGRCCAWIPQLLSAAGIALKPGRLHGHGPEARARVRVGEAAAQIAMAPPTVSWVCRVGGRCRLRARRPSPLLNARASDPACALVIAPKPGRVHGYSPEARALAGAGMQRFPGWRPPRGTARPRAPQVIAPKPGPLDSLLAMHGACPVRGCGTDVLTLDLPTGFLVGSGLAAHLALAARRAPAHFAAGRADGQDRVFAGRLAAGACGPAADLRTCGTA